MTPDSLVGQLLVWHLELRETNQTLWTRHACERVPAWTVSSDLRGHCAVPYRKAIKHGAGWRHGALAWLDEPSGAE
jgi:hypothetical protein